jgi:hypothetical protein
MVNKFEIKLSAMLVIIIQFLFINVLSQQPNGQKRKQKKYTHTQIINSIQHKYKK